MKGRKVVVVGAGLCGPLVAILLARRGHQVHLFEARGDLRHEAVSSGRSINLTISERGLAALRALDLEDEVVTKLCTSLTGRAIHDTDGHVVFSPYGVDEREVLHAISRSELTKFLISAAEAEPGVNLWFHQHCESVDKETGSVTFVDQRTGLRNRVHADLVVGADGAYSTVRRYMQRGEIVDFSQHFVNWRYKELTITADAQGAGFDPHALHVWPRGDLMMFALPNQNGSFNGVCVLPASCDRRGPDALRADSDVRRFFTQHFPDVTPFLPRLTEEFSSRPASGFPTVRTSQWHYKDKIVLIGDSCHGVVPFYGQGMNAGFEDCIVLDQCLAAHADTTDALVEYQQRRKPNTDVLADLSIANFTELCDTARRPSVAARKQVMLALNRLLGDRVLPLYTMVSHTTIPYEECVARARRQERIARLCGIDVVVGAMVAAKAARRVVAPRTTPARVLPIRADGVRKGSEPRQDEGGVGVDYDHALARSSR